MFGQMKDNQKFMENEEDLNFLAKMEADLNFKENGRWFQF